MPKVIEVGNPQGRLSEMLGMSLGQGIGNGLNTYFANRSLNSVLHDKALEGAPQSQKLEAIRAALSPYGEKGQEIFQQRMAIEQQAMNEGQQDVLGRVTEGQKVEAKDLAKLSPENQLKVMQIQKNRQIGRSVYESLIKSGYPEETAKIWQQQMENAPTGGQTDVIKKVNEMIQRSPKGKGKQNSLLLNTPNKIDNVLEGPYLKNVDTNPKLDIPGIDLEPFPLDFPELPEQEGMTPSEMIKQNEYREKANTPLYNEAVDRLNALDEEFRAVKHLQELNEMPGVLPTGGEKWNVNWDTGDLRVKALATPEAQDYAKTIALLARNAKNFFPGRVTNFDLDQFKQGFPTLANSPEGRRLIAQQLSLGNRIAYLKDETFKAAMDHYGSGADPHLVKKYATENYRKLKSQLEEQLMKVNGEARLMAAEGGPKMTPEERIQSAKTVEELWGQ